jgi:predicted nucleic acid-binding protein
MKAGPDPSVVAWVNAHVHEIRLCALVLAEIAAIARAWSLTLVTRNEKDFPLMTVVNPFTTLA